MDREDCDNLGGVNDNWVNIVGCMDCFEVFVDITDDDGLGLTGKTCVGEGEPRMWVTVG